VTELLIKKGQSLPSFFASWKSISVDNPNSKYSFKDLIRMAASDEPPHNPDPIGIPLTSFISIGGILYSSCRSSHAL